MVHQYHLGVCQKDKISALSMDLLNHHVCKFLDIISLNIFFRASFPSPQTPPSPRPLPTSLTFLSGISIALYFRPFDIVPRASEALFIWFLNSFLILKKDNFYWSIFKFPNFLFLYFPFRKFPFGYFSISLLRFFIFSFFISIVFFT